MLVYSVLSLLTIIFGFISSYIGENNKKKFSYLGLFIILFIWVSVYAFRFEVGSDFYGYVRNYFRASNIGYKQYINAYRDVGFYSVTWIANRLFQHEWIPYNFLLGTLTYFPILLVIAKKGEYFITSILIVIFSMLYFSGFNGVRQAIAVSIVFYAYYMCFREKKYFKYILLLLIAFSFHSTALVVIPFHILSKMKVKSKYYLLFIAIMLFSYFTLFSLWENVINVLEGLGQEKLASDYADISDGRGSSFLRFAVGFMPVIVSYVFYNRLKYYDYDDSFDSDVMICTFAGIFSLFSMKYWGFSRIGLYFISSQAMLIPKFANLFNTRRGRYVLFLIIILLYYAYMMSLLLHGEGKLVPYQTIFGIELSGNWHDYDF